MAGGTARGIRHLTLPALSRAWLVPVPFAVFGFLFGVWQVLLTDLSDALHISAGPLGVALSAGVVASLPAMVVGGRLADRWGRQALIVGAGGVMAACFVRFSLVGAYAGLVVLLVCFFAASGVYDVGINAAAMAHEQVTGRRVIPLLHAAFSGGAATGAIAAGALAAAGVSYRLMYASVAAIMAVTMGMLWAGGAGAGTNPRTARLGAGGLFRDRAILLVAGITCLGFFLEGIMETWSVIYLRASLELPVLLGASGAAVFHLAMLAGRLTTAGTVHRLGRHGTLRGAGMLAALGMTVALATERPPLILAGFLTVGLALAGVAPVAFSLAGDLAPDRAGQARSVLTTLAYGGFLLGPSLIGGVAELTSLRAALMSGIVTGLLIALLSARVDLREGVNEAGQA